MHHQSTHPRHPFPVLTGVLLVLGLCATPWARAEEKRAFTLESLQGSYAYVNNTGGVASFGPLLFDGHGGLTLKDTVNLPCAAPGVGCRRSISALTGEGAYTVNPDGTGVATITFTESNGTVRPPDVFDFMIAATIKKGQLLLATQVFAADRAGGLAGQLVAPTWTRLAD